MPATIVCSSATILTSTLEVEMTRAHAQDDCTQDVRVLLCLGTWSVGLHRPQGVLLELERGVDRLMISVWPTSIVLALRIAFTAFSN